MLAKSRMERLMLSLIHISAAEEGKVLNIWCWNDEFQSRFNDYYPGVKEIAADKSTTTLDLSLIHI